MPTAFFRSAVAEISVLTLAAFGAVQGCTDVGDTEPHVPARAGAFQPEGGGPLISEAEACERVTQAEDEARAGLGCEPAERAECPGYIRPPGGGACYRYDEASVEGCVEFFGGLLNCAELDRRRCIVIAELDPTLPGCEAGQGGAGGEGGGAGAPGGAAGQAGAAGAGAGAGGEGGLGGAPGAAGGGGQGGA